MSIFVPNKVYLRGILLHYFIQKKSAAEAHRILVQTYGDMQIASKDMSFFRRGIHVLPERWEKVVSSDGQYFK
ncbi:MOS1T transposase, partial [Pseudoatta argentina]